MIDCALELCVKINFYSLKLLCQGVFFITTRNQEIKSLKSFESMNTFFLVTTMDVLFGRLSTTENKKIYDAYSIIILLAALFILRYSSS